MAKWAKTTEDGKNLESTIEESLGVKEAVCSESGVSELERPYSAQPEL